MSMSTQQRLDNYLAAEARILERGFSLRLADRQRQEAELGEIRKAISSLQSQLAAEQGGKGSSHGSLRYKTVVFGR